MLLGVGCSSRKTMNPAREAIERFFHRGAMLIEKRRTLAQVEALRRALNFRQRTANLRAPGAGIAHHDREYVRIEHALHRNAFGCGFEAGDPADAVHQRFAMMRARAAHQRAVDIEERERAENHSEWK